MFTLEQVSAAHAKVKGGADFPAYVQDLIRLGVESYDIFVTDGHGEYQGEKNYSIRSAAGYATLHIVDSSNKETFIHNLKYINKVKRTTLPSVGMLQTPVWKNGRLIRRK